MLIELKQAIQLIQEHRVIAIPTETVYGLAASLSSQSAIQSIFSLKNRPSQNPLIVHVADQKQAESLIGSMPPSFDLLTKSYWPGSLTLVVPASDHVPSIVRAGLPTVGLRVPNHPLSRALLQETGPLVAPSANLSGRPSSTCPEHVVQDFGDQLPILDGGICDKGLESTILVFHNGKWDLGRLGAIPYEELETLLGDTLTLQTAVKPLCPGQQFRHYSPKARLHLSQSAYTGNPDTVLGFEERQYPGAKEMYSLGRLSDPQEISQNLYSTLRQLDIDGVKNVWVDINFDQKGMLLTVDERLKKAAHQNTDGYPNLF